MTARLEPGEKLARQIARSSYFEDRLEYDVEDLVKAYQISEGEAQALYQRLRELAGWK